MATRYSSLSVRLKHPISLAEMTAISAGILEWSAVESVDPIEADRPERVEVGWPPAGCLTHTACAYFEKCQLPECHHYGKTSAWPPTDCGARGAAGAEECRRSRECIFANRSNCPHVGQKATA